MKRLITLLVLAGLAFYGAWPAYSGYTIKQALAAKDTDTLSAKIDFPSVRESMRPAVSAKVEASLAKSLKKAGPAGGELLKEMSKDITPKIADAVLAVLVKPETLIRIYTDGGRVKDSINRIISEEVSTSAAGGGLGELLGKGGDGAGGSGGLLDNLGKAAEQFGFDTGKTLGGLTGKKAETPTKTNKSKSGSAPKYGLDNIKHFGLDGPLAISLGVAKDPAAKDPDVTAEMSFVGNDWKLTGLVPKL